jgi:hypothetical protein
MSNNRKAALIAAALATLVVVSFIWIWHDLDHRIEAGKRTETSQGSQVGPENSPRRLKR